MSPSDLLNTIDQQKVWEHIVGEGRINHSFLRPSWLGPDHKPSCRLSIKGNKIRFHDPARSINWDCLDGMNALYPNLSWQEKEEKMLLWSGTSRPTSNLLESGELFEKRFVLIPKIIDWTQWGLSYWEARGVSKERLSNPQTLVQEVCGHEIAGTNQQGDFFSSQDGQGFVFHCNGKIKIYYPFAEKERKWKGKLGPEDVCLVDRSRHRTKKGVPDTKTLLIAKGRKDMLVWSTIVDCDLMELTAEGVLPNANWFLTNVRMKYERCVIILDPDEAGIQGANKLLNILLNLSDIGTFVVKSWPFPDPISKDLDRYRVDNGHAQTIKFLKQNNFHKIFEQ